MEYWVVTEESLDDISKKIAGNFADYQRNLKSYFERELKRATNYDHHLIVLMDSGEWKTLDIHKQYNVDFVMKHHFGRGEE